VHDQDLPGGAFTLNAEDIPGSKNFNRVVLMYEGGMGQENEVNNQVLDLRKNEPPSTPRARRRKDQDKEKEKSMNRRPRRERGNERREEAEKESRPRR
jgi:hypothetical protein